MTGPLVPLCPPLPQLLIRSNMQLLHLKQEAVLIRTPNFWLISNSLREEIDKADGITSIIITLSGIVAHFAG